MTAMIFAHRGSSAAYAEHTRAAYLQAIADGADGVECDLHLTADGALVLLHDADISRTSNSSGAVAKMTLAQLRAVDFSSWHGSAIPPEFGTTAEQLLTLAELLDILSTASRPMSLAIEFKYGGHFDPALVEAALDTLRGRGWSPETSTVVHSVGHAVGEIEVSFMSFHPEAVLFLAQHVAAEKLCALLEVVGPEDRLQWQRQQLVDDGVALLAGPGVQYLRAYPGDVARWLAVGRTLRVWTVDSAQDLELCLGAGVTQLTSNKPGALREMLTERH
ncbi:glycerophosphodiester phosphodiesterase [Arthrobacter psychrochitiniphilus]|uniref:glycerophosphodiester phosphodiesterase n=1 Tax=Arthrobacter psychrochitiniphilus TaxID=291045 RepID=UPI003F7BDDE7